MILLTVTTVALACGDGGDDQPDKREWIDGARLRALTVSFPGSEAAQVDLYDQELETVCVFRQTTDGELRCVPDTNAFTSLFYYSSPDCAESSALVIAFGCDTSERFALAPSEDSCTDVFRAYEIGPPYTGDNVYVGGGDNCEETKRPIGEIYLTLGDEIAPERMVAAQRTPVGGGRLEGYDYVAEDGTRRPSIRFRDTELDEDCFFQTAVDGSTRCLPGDFIDFRPPRFADKDCRQQAVLGSPCASPFGLVEDESECEERLALYAVGEPVAGATVYEENAGECVASGESDYLQPIGDEIPPSAMAGASLETRGSGRVRTQWWRPSSGEEVFAGWWDEELGVRCFAMDLGDGRTVCAPFTPVFSSEGYYSDPGCTERAPLVRQDSSCDEGGIAVEFVDACPMQRFYRIAGDVEGDLFTVDDETFECRAATVSERAGLRTVALIDPATLERATEGSASGSRALVRGEALHLPQLRAVRAPHGSGRSRR